MSEQLELTDNVTNVRQDYEQRKKTEQDILSKDAIDTARKMVTEMSGGAPFNYEDFIFAMSLGRPEQFSEEIATLKSVGWLKGGEVVGVFSSDKSGHKWLFCAGISSGQPLEMSVKLGMRDDVIEKAMPLVQYNRRLEAGIRLQMVTKRRFPGPGPTLLGSPETLDELSVPLLTCHGEPSKHEGPNALVNLRTVVIGARDLLAQVAEFDSDMGSKIVAECFNNVAKIAYLGNIASR